jgi:DNA mismatch endonuclease (patch repair protein)
VAGTPDLAWKNRKVAVFVDSAWWHGHPSRWSPGRLPKGWDEKIQANRNRDTEVTKKLKEEGWTIVRIWDFDLDADIDECVARVAKAIRAV